MCSPLLEAARADARLIWEHPNSPRRRALHQCVACGGAGRHTLLHRGEDVVSERCFGQSGLYEGGTLGAGVCADLRPPTIRRLSRTAVPSHGV